MRPGEWRAVEYRNEATGKMRWEVEFFPEDPAAIRMGLQYSPRYRSRRRAERRARGLNREDAWRRAG